MKASELSLGHKCYKVTVDSIQEAEVDGIITSNEKGKMVVCFKNDYMHYLVNMNDKNIAKTYFFSRDDAAARQNKLRIKALWNAAIKKAKASEEYDSIKQKYQELSVK